MGNCKMKIKFSIITTLILSATIIQAIRIKTDTSSELLFSSSNFNQKDQPKLMETIQFKKSTKVQSRIFEGKNLIKKSSPVATPSKESGNKDFIDESNFIEVTKTKVPGQQNQNNRSEPKIDLKNMEIPEIKRAKKEDPNPLNRRFGNLNESKRQISLMLDTDRIHSIESELLQKMSDQIQLNFGAFDKKDSMKMHLEKVPITMTKQ